MQSCPGSCPRLKKKSGSNQGIRPHEQEDENVEKDSFDTRQSPTQREKAVQIGGVTRVPKSSSEESGRSNRSGVPHRAESNEGNNKTSEASGSGAYNERGRMYNRGRAADWDPNGHDPCPPDCPMAMARERAMRRASLRQERLDDYLLNKGFSYFDDVCTCSFMCVINQLRRDKFVMDLLKSVCLFGLGFKLCDELDAWSLFS